MTGNLPAEEPENRKLVVRNFVAFSLPTIIIAARGMDLCPRCKMWWRIAIALCLSSMRSMITEFPAKKFRADGENTRLSNGSFILGCRRDRNRDQDFLFK